MEGLETVFYMVCWDNCTQDIIKHPAKVAGISKFDDVLSISLCLGELDELYKDEHHNRLRMSKRDFVTFLNGRKTFSAREFAEYYFHNLLMKRLKKNTKKSRGCHGDCGDCGL